MCWCFFPLPAYVCFNTSSSSLATGFESYMTALRCSAARPPISFFPPFFLCVKGGKGVNNHTFAIHLGLNVLVPTGR